MGLLDRLFGKDKGKKKRLDRKHPYFRLHVWIESRIGPLQTYGSDEYIKKELKKLLKSEEKRCSKKQVAGLKAYIETNSYRKMLEQ
jgi:hypothetical protein